MTPGSSIGASYEGFAALLPSFSASGGRQAPRPLSGQGQWKFSIILLPVFGIRQEGQHTCSNFAEGTPLHHCGSPRDAHTDTSSGRWYNATTERKASLRPARLNSRLPGNLAIVQTKRAAGAEQTMRTFA